MREASPAVLAALVSDIHLSDKAPLARAEKENWQDVQFGHLTELRKFCHRHNCPLVIGGDIFDKWKISPEVVNRAIFMFKGFAHGVFAVPGNHDLPLHNYKDRKKSSYWTLVQAGAVIDLPPDRPVVVNDRLCLHGFPWGFPLEPSQPDVATKNLVHLAVCHAYVWLTADSSFPGAPDDRHLDAYKGAAGGYQAVLFGDNHKRFSVHHAKTKTHILNPGAFVCRRSDEKAHIPVMGALTESGKIDLHPLDTSNDKWIEAADDLAKAEVRGAPLEQFLEELKNDSEAPLDFRLAVIGRLQGMKGLSDKVRSLILLALEDE